MTRMFIDAHPSVRCDARVKLKDKTYAACGRRQSQTCCKVCTQHRKMFRDGKVVVDFATGLPMLTIIDRQKRGDR